MRRRIRSAALPLHRHSLPQLAVDGVLVALAYYLAFQLRFDSGPPPRYDAPARSNDLVGRVREPSGPRAVGVYQRRWRYSGQSDYEARRAGAVLVIVLCTVVAVEVLRPVHRYPDGHPVAVVLPNGVIILFALLALVFLVGIRAIARSDLRAPPAGRVPRPAARASVPC